MAYPIIGQRETDIGFWYDLRMGIGDRVKERREALGLTQPQLAKAIKDRGASLSQGQISSLEAGSVERPRALPELASALRTSVDWLLTGQEPARPLQTPPHNPDIIPNPSVSRIVTASEPLIVWRSAPNQGRSGEMLIYKEQAGVATRPVELADSKEAFAVKVVDRDAAPRYEPRATLLIDPWAPPAEGDDCLFVQNADDNPMTAAARRLVRVTAEHWVVRRFHHGAKEQKLDRAQWQSAWYIFGSYNRR